MFHYKANADQNGAAPGCFLSLFIPACGGSGVAPSRYTARRHLNRRAAAGFRARAQRRANARPPTAARRTTPVAALGSKGSGRSRNHRETAIHAIAC